MISLFLVDHSLPVSKSVRSSLEALPGCRLIGHELAVPDALNGIRQRRPDVAVISVGSDFPTAVETSRRVRTEEPSARVMLIASTPTSKQLVRALEAGVHGIVTNPADLMVLAAAVRAVCAGVTYLSQEATEIMVNDYLRRKARNSRKTQFGRLSGREREVLQRLTSGESTSDIAHALNLSPKTVDTYRRRAMVKLEVTTVAALVKVAIANEVTAS